MSTPDLFPPGMRGFDFDDDALSRDGAKAATILVVTILAATAAVIAMWVWCDRPPVGCADHAAATVPQSAGKSGDRR